VIFTARVAADPEPAVAKLIDKLNDPSAAVRLEAIKKLEVQGKTARDAVPALIDLLKLDRGNRARERETIFGALERIGLDRTLLPTLVKMVRDENRIYADNAAQLLRIMGTPAIPTLLELMRDASEDVRFRAVAAVAWMREPPADKLLLALLERLHDDSKDIRLQAAFSIGLAFKARAEKAVPELIKALADNNLGAAGALGQIGPAARSAVPALRVAVHDLTTSRVVTKLSPSSGKMTTRPKTMAEYAAQSLGEIGREARAAVPDLLRMLLADNAAVRVEAGVALAHVAPADRKNALALYQLLLLSGLSHEPDEEVRLVAALGRMDHAVPYLAAIASHGSSHLRKLAAEQLGNRGPLARAAVRDLGFALRHTDPQVRGAAAKALGQIGPGARMALLQLRTLAAKDRSEEVRKTAAEAVKLIDTKE
jgi:HEAT repeat protein